MAREAKGDKTMENCWPRGSSRASIPTCGSTLYVGLARAVSPTNTNFWLTFLLTRLQEALSEESNLKSTITFLALVS